MDASRQADLVERVYGRLSGRIETIAAEASPGCNFLDTISDYSPMLALECVRTRLRLGIAEERCKVTVPLLLERAARSVFILNTYLFLMETYLDFRESELRGIAYSDISGKGVNAYVVGAARRLSGLRTL